MNKRSQSKTIDKQVHVITRMKSGLPKQPCLTSKKPALHMSHFEPITFGLQLQLPYICERIVEGKN